WLLRTNGGVGRTARWQARQSGSEGQIDCGADPHRGVLCGLPEQQEWSMMIDITVKVPEDRVPEFYSMYGAWLNGAPHVLMSTATRNADSGGDHLPWSDSDGALAAEVWDKFSGVAKRLFSRLIDEPDRRFSGEELASLLDIPNGKHGVAGV